MSRMVASQRRQLLVRLLAPVHDDGRRFARRLCKSDDEGDDLFHEAVLRAYDKLSSLRNPNSFRFWFFRIIITLHYSRARRAFWRRFIVLDRDDLVGDDGGAWEEQRFRATRVRKALAKLPADQRAAIVMHELQGFSIEEIATIQEASIPAVKSRLSRGREELRRYYERAGLAPELASVRVLVEKRS
ncbi:MAG TPA: RNA polymerase sigma factor [Kofleriaceae bacterium]|jgi:RNA polymerase sigma-70 factor (ECF subfamily)|nr:RNA polymerase sigma factor [Kofleriaceae bacterium]